MTSLFEHFYSHSEETRRKLVSDFAELSKKDRLQLQERAQTGDAKALIENYLTAYQLPEGVAVNLTVNNQLVLTPMVVEEPSVIAAASNGAKLAGNVSASVASHLLMGQVVLQNVAVFEEVNDWVKEHENQLLTVAQNAHPSLTQRGGGPRSLRVRDLGEGYVSLDLFVDVKEAMGANMVNTMLEALAEVVQQAFSTAPLFSILSNASDSSLATAQVSIPFDRLDHNPKTGEAVANRIAAASRVAQLDPYRAVTHNKGIMNGVDAVVVAMGNDWRAVEAAAHNYAVKNGQYRGLSDWHVDRDALVGQLTLPLPLGVVGGATRVLPMAQTNQKIAQIDSVEQLMNVVVALGLVQNLAALKALVTSGIQKGHMKMQLRALAMTVGAKTPTEIDAVVTALKRVKDPSEQLASQALIQHRNKREG